jgi:SNF family Na+-dependent transporter
MQAMTVWGWLSLGLGWGLILGFALFCVWKIVRIQRRQATLLPGAAPARGQWATRTGLILAMAGNAIGLGNFLRFPVKAAANGGGAFLIPYVLAFLLLGIPLMWVEWTVGRYGGARGHGSTPGQFQLLWRHPAAKYLGALGIALPFGVVIFYAFIASWTAGFAWFSGSGAYWGLESREEMGQFLRGFQGAEENQFFDSPIAVLAFLTLTLGINYLFLRRGIARGIELLARWGMPLLFLFAAILVARVLTLGAPEPALADRSVGAGLAYMWNPDFSRLGESTVWLVAAGQIFFTLSLGQGMINTYASYVPEDRDIALNGLTTSLTNELAEVILGATIAIPAAVAFFGLAETQAIARGGAFDLGFQTMPLIFQKLPLGQLFGCLWFFLLFIAAVTSSVAMTQPAVAFLEDELGWSKARALHAVFAFQATCTLAVVFFFRYGFLDELDFWVGTFGLVILALVEVVLFAWVFGVERGVRELERGADLRVPRVLKPILKYITPTYLLIILVAWSVQDAWANLRMDGVPEEQRPYRWAARGLILLILGLSLWLVRLAWRRKARSTASDSPATIEPG